MTNALTRALITCSFRQLCFVTLPTRNTLQNVTTRSNAISRHTIIILIKHRQETNYLLNILDNNEANP